MRSLRDGYRPLHPHEVRSMTLVTTRVGDATQTTRAALGLPRQPARPGRAPEFRLRAHAFGYSLTDLGPRTFGPAPATDPQHSSEQTRSTT